MAVAGFEFAQGYSTSLAVELSATVGALPGETWTNGGVQLRAELLLIQAAVMQMAERVSESAGRNASVTGRPVPRRGGVAERPQRGGGGVDGGDRTPSMRWPGRTPAPQAIQGITRSSSRAPEWLRPRPP